MPDHSEKGVYSNEITRRITFIHNALAALTWENENVHQPTCSVLGEVKTMAKSPIIKAKMKDGARCIILDERNKIFKSLSEDG